MLFGTSTMNFYGKKITESLTKIAKAGFDYAEIWLDQVWDEELGATTSEIKTTLTDLNLKSTVHCPILDINITSANPGIRRESIRQNLLALEFTKKIGADLLVLHPGTPFSIRQSKEEHFNAQLKALKEIYIYGKELNVRIALENLDSNQEVVTVKYYEDLLAIFQALEIERQEITLDITHLGTTENVLDFIEKAKSKIAHLHFSDATESAMHLRLHEGELDLNLIVKALQKIDYQGVCSLECFIPGDLELLKLELEKVRKLWLDT